MNRILSRGCIIIMGLAFVSVLSMTAAHATPSASPAGVVPAAAPATDSAAVPSTTTTTTTTTSPAPVPVANANPPAAPLSPPAEQASAQAVATAEAQVPTASSAAPTGDTAAPTQTTDQTALPSTDGVNPRAPGLMLSNDNAAAPDANSPAADPFAEPAAPTPKTAEQIEAEIRSRAYDAAVTGLLPLRPGEIRKLLETYDKTQQAVEIPVYPYPKPQVVIQTVSLDPGAQPLEIKVATGHVSTLNIMDVTGAPWPIQDMSWAGNFEIVQPEAGGAVLRITPMSEFAYGNISIRLIGLNTPITFVMKAHRDVVQYRFDARIPGFGPNAKPPVIKGGLNIAAGNSIMASILEGVAPDGAVRMNVAGVDGRTSAYKYADSTYVRTPLTLLSPGWSSSVSSGDGMNVYQLRDAPVLLLSEDGDMKRARLSDKDAGDKDQAK